jgi:hypothetical protein
MQDYSPLKRCRVLHSNGASSCPCFGSIYRLDASGSAISDDTHPLWRGSLLPLGCAAVAKPANDIDQTNRDAKDKGRFAAQREQAPSPQVTSHKPQATSHRSQATSHKPQATSHKPQATSHKPQGMMRTRYLVIHNFFTNANHRLSFKQVRSICVNGSVDYGRFVANRFE